MSERYRRVRLEKLEIEELSDTECTSRVVLSWSPDDTYEGTASADNSPRGQLRCAAEATARALEAASDGKVWLEVLAVKAIEGFDTVLAIVSISSEIDIGERLTGSCLIQGEAPRSAVLAVLSAINRLYGRAVLGDETSLSDRA